MSAYFLHDGRNERGPFTIEFLKKEKLTRNTPIRKKDSDNWMPAEKFHELKELVASKKIKHLKDILPVISEGYTHLRKNNPGLLYGVMLALVLLASFSTYSIRRTVTSRITEPVQQIQSMPAAAVTATLTNAPKDELPKPLEVKTTVPPFILKKEKESKEKTTRLRWNKLITASNSNYGIGVLGGIKDLHVTLTNHTDYPIDEAVLKVTYIKANGGVWKSVPVNIFDVPAHDSKEEPVADVGRGKKVKVSIEKIVSKKMKFSYAEGQEIKDIEDPYLLK